jgi:hypothetical protein
MVKAQSKVRFVEIKSIEAKSVTRTVKKLLGILTPPEHT